jgi:hypothetical protein
MSPVWTNFEICVFFERINGGEGRKVSELRPVIVFELEAYPEPKALSRIELLALIKIFSSTVKVARHIGSSQAFVWEQLSTKRESKT